MLNVFVFFFLWSHPPPRPLSIIIIIIMTVIILHLLCAVCGAPCWRRRDLPQDLCPVYRPGEWEQLPSERDLNPFSRYEALDPKRPIVLDDIENGTVTVKT